MPQPRGALNNLRFVPFDRQAPAHGEVKVRMTVLISLGVLSTLSGTHEACGAPLGCSKHLLMPWKPVA